MATVTANPKSKEFTSTESGLVLGKYGKYRLDYVADAYGSMSIDELNASGTYVTNAGLSYSAETHKVVQLVPEGTIRITITGGTNPVVTLTELPRGV